MEGSYKFGIFRWSVSFVRPFIGISLCSRQDLRFFYQLFSDFLLEVKKSKEVNKTKTKQKKCWLVFKRFRRTRRYQKWVFWTFDKSIFHSCLVVFLEYENTVSQTFCKYQFSVRNLVRAYFKKDKVSLRWKCPFWKKNVFFLNINETYQK